MFKIKKSKSTIKIYSLLLIKILIIIHHSKVSIVSLQVQLILRQRILIDKVLNLRVILTGNILIFFCEIQILICEDIGIILGDETELLQNGNRLLRDVWVVMIGDHVIGQQLHNFRICHFIIVEGVYFAQQVNYFILLAYHIHSIH